MSYEKRADYGVAFLFPPALEDWIAADHPARFIREFVDALDLEELGFRKREAEEGRPNYAADLLVKVWLYGYCSEIRSVRKLERACRDSVALIWLTGMHEPDHNTLWRFWRDNQKGIRKLFIEAVRVAAQANIVGAVLQAVDGTKIQAQSSGRSGLEKAELERLLEQIEKSLEEAGGSEMEEAEGYRLPEEMKDRRELQERIKEALAEMKEIDREQLHPGEPEARLMKCGRGFEFGYNAQAVIDEASGLIVAGDVVNEESDNNQLLPMIEQAKQNVGRAAALTVADGGYTSGEGLAAAEELGHQVLVNLGPQHLAPENEFHSSHFRYDEGRDCCVCPRGEELKFERVKRNRRKRYAVRVYRCQSFKECPVRWQCSKDRKGRTIELTPYDGAFRRQREKLAQADNQAALRKRMTIAEPPFGQIKHCFGFRRWTVRGLEGVKTQWSLVATAFDLRKLHKYWVAGRLSFDTG
jgi:transposase